MKYTREVTKISVLKNNTGQIPGVPKNPRFIKDDNFVKLKQSITDDPHFMELREIIAYKQEINDKTELIVIAGNMRLRACKDLGWQEVPAKIVSDLTPEQIRAIVIKDNVGYGDNDYDALANEWDMVELEEWGLELPPGVGIDQEIEEDEVPELDGEAVSSVLGTVYQLGRHRVMCGDSTDFGSISDLMNGKTADMVFTDPPYGVGYEQGKFTGATVKKKFDKIANDELKADELYDFTKSVFEVVKSVTADNAPYYVWSQPMQEGYEIHKAVKDTGVHIQSQIIWDKQRLVLGRADYHWQHEICWYGYKKDEANHHWNGGRKQTTIWQQSKDSKYDHPTQKPVELAHRAINNSCRIDGIVLDVFLGSGSTLIACEQTDRTCYGMELDPKYVDVIRKRYAKYCYPDTWEDRWEELTPAIN